MGASFCKEKGGEKAELYRHKEVAYWRTRYKSVVALKTKNWVYGVVSCIRQSRDECAVVK